jgi:hypothetical protein
MTTRSRHFPAYDWDCDDGDMDRVPAPRPRVRVLSAHRRIRERPTDGGSTEQVVECPFRDAWPTFEACLGCPSFRGYSLDPAGEDSFVSCSRVDTIHAIPHSSLPRVTHLATVLDED